jgi:hypothetical protein
MVHRELRTGRLFRERNSDFSVMFRRFREICERGPRGKGKRLGICFDKRTFVGSVATANKGGPSRIYLLRAMRAQWEL